MLIGIDSSPCSLSLRNRSMFNDEMSSKYIGLKKCFCTKIFFFNIFYSFNFLFLLESAATIFRQSAGYVFLFPTSSEKYFSVVASCFNYEFEKLFFEIVKLF